MALPQLREISEVLVEHKRGFLVPLFRGKNTRRQVRRGKECTCNTDQLIYLTVSVLQAW